MAVPTRLHQCGVRLAIDDFAVGHFPEGYVHRLRVDVRKVDGLFVAELNDPRSVRWRTPWTCR
jgi:EAL domain-containing protein (putative c-di-GMP-specific phosphodiesterase class I)